MSDWPIELEDLEDSASGEKTDSSEASIESEPVPLRGFLAFVFLSVNVWAAYVAISYIVIYSSHLGIGGLYVEHLQLMVDNYHQIKIYLMLHIAISTVVGIVLSVLMMGFIFWE